MSRKNFAATGSFVAEDRPRALDLLGFSSQLVFNTFHNRRLRDWEHGGDLELAFGAARAHNRGMVEFCSVDDRLLPTCYVPLADIEPAPGLADEAIDRRAPPRCSIASGCPPGHSPSHVGLDPVWAQAQEAGIPVVFHVGGTGDLIEPGYFQNGLPIPPDFHGGEENFRSVDYMGIPAPAHADAGHDDLRRRARAVPRPAHRRHRAGRHLGAVVDAPDGVGLRRLRPPRGAPAGASACARPSTSAARSASRPTPPRTWAGSSPAAGPEVCLFSSDYPHVEGGRKPLERFEASLGDVADAVRQAFYCDNFLDLMGTRRPRNSPRLAVATAGAAVGRGRRARRHRFTHRGRFRARSFWRLIRRS